MIYSAFEDNHRAKHSFHMSEYFAKQKKKIEDNRAPNRRGNLVHLNLDTFEIEEQERFMIEASICWMVIALESFLNHAIAEIFFDQEKAASAIDSPRKKIFNHISNNGEPEFLRSLSILIHPLILPEPLHTISKLVQMRNEIVHDKPLFLELVLMGMSPLIISQKDKYGVKSFLTRNDVSDFFQSDRVITYISEKSSLDNPGLKFSDLLQKGAIIPMKQYRRIMAGRKSMYAKQCREGGFIGSDYGFPEDLSDFLPDSWREFNEKAYPRISRQKTRENQDSCRPCLWYASWTLQGNARREYCPHS
jgi:hypothetical protein